jgi:hypothetical protein
MIALKPTKLTLTLFTYVALALLIASAAEATTAQDINRRDHAQLNRMLKKRSPSPQLVPVVGAAPDPATATAASSTTNADTATSAATTSSSSSSNAATTTSATSTTTTSSSSSSSSSVRVL